MRAVWVSALGAVTLGLGGCVGPLCDSGREAAPSWGEVCFEMAGVPELGGAVRAEAAVDIQARVLGEMQADLRRQLGRGASVSRAEMSRPRHVLMLSGGGQWGAYGAGSLVAWTARGDRPVFDVVSGVSTGALIATFAFLGPEYDGVLRENYTEISTRDVLRPRSLLALPFASSLATVDGLRGLIDKHITMEVMREVAREHSRGRSLWVGVVELKTGLFLPVNLGEIASRGGEEALREYRDAVLASASIPVVFPPVCRGGLAFVDGGTRQNIFFPALCEAVAPPGDGSVVLYALVNGVVETSPQFEIRGSLIGIGARAVDLLFDEAVSGTLFRLETLALERGWEYRVASVSPGDCWDARRECPDSLVNQFCTGLMRCLFETAGARIRGGRFWRDPLVP